MNDDTGQLPGKPEGGIPLNQIARPGENVINFPVPKHEVGNGALEAMRRYFVPIGPHLSMVLMPDKADDLPRADHFLLWLWNEGFKIVPTEKDLLVNPSEIAPHLNDAEFRERYSPLIESFIDWRARLNVVLELDPNGSMEAAISKAEQIAGFD